MDIYLSHSSSLTFWSSFEISSGALARCQDSRSPSWRKDEPLPSECKVTELLIRELADRMPELEGIALPLHVIVPSQAARSRCGKVALPRQLPQCFPEDRSYASPATCLQARPSSASCKWLRSCPLPALIRLGFELCGASGVATVGKADFRFERPFTTPARLARFLDKAANVPRQPSEPEKPSSTSSQAPPPRWKRPWPCCSASRSAWAGTRFPNRV